MKDTEFVCDVIIICATGILNCTLLALIIQEIG